MRVLAICTYPRESAATRFRLEQYVAPLAEMGIQLEIRPFLTSKQFTELYEGGSDLSKALKLLPSIGGRIRQIFSLSGFDLLLVQREAMFFGPGIFEFLYRKLGKMRMVLDLDDATYVPYQSPNFGKAANYLKFFGKTDRLIERSETVICGNRYIAEYVEGNGKRTVIIPTISDPRKFSVHTNSNEIPVIGWIGTNSTYPFVKRLFPVISRLAEKHRFKLKIIGAGKRDSGLVAADTEFIEWDLARENNDIQSFDLGLYPIFNEGSVDENWLMGKSGFKAIQYMAAGIPFVMSPVGVCADIGEDGKTHFNASTDEDWYNHLDTLLRSEDLRSRMGKSGHLYAIENFSLDTHAKKFAEVLFSAASGAN